MRISWIVFVGISIVWLSITPSEGAEYHVKQDGTGDFFSIQLAVDNVLSDGDTIIVHPGIYYENVEFWGPTIVLRSSDPEDPAVVESTVIDGGWNGSVVTFTGAEHESCLVSGFTITNGHAYHGGGIRGGDSVFPHTKATITNCRIINNSAYNGGGIAHCDGTIANCVVAANWIRAEYPAGRGGGMYDCRASIISCTINDNNAFGGGGLYDCDGAISLCTISNNYCSFTPSHGGGLSYCDGVIDGCIINSNTTMNDGGGLYSCDARIINCTVYDNSATSNGGGLYQCLGKISNCIIWANRATKGNDLDACSQPSYSCILDWAGGGQGNTSEDPLFARREDGDYHLLSGSPCIDNGDNWATTGEPDLDGQPRIINGTVDMGAYEHLNGCYVSIRADERVYFGECAMVLHLAAGNFGPTQVVDLYAAIRVPRGPLLFLPSLSTDCTPWARGVELPSGYVLDPLEAFLHPFSGVEPVGTYVLYWLLVPHGTTDITDMGSMIVTSSFKYRRQFRTEFNLKADGTGDFSSIQGAIDEAIDGETIILHAGTYYENIRFRGRNIVLCSLDPDAPRIVESTIIDGRKQDSVVTFTGAEDDTCVLSGLTIRNGRGDVGGGIYGAGSRAAITNCTFMDNEASRGGALYSCHGDITHCVIVKNSAYGGAGLARCDGSVSDCLIIDNVASIEGGGLYGCTAAVKNCTISSNTAGYDGGGLTGCFGAICNCIIWGNHASYGPDLADNGSPTYSLIGIWFPGGSNIVGRSPRFTTGPLGDYYLSRGSPCIDAGYGSAEDAGLSDRTTQADGTRDTRTVDMGYHYPISSGG